MRTSIIRRSARRSFTRAGGCSYKVAILSQPDFRDEHDFLEMGRPRYAVLINGGNIDSMVAHYTSAKKRRSDDAYTPGGVGGKRPDRAVTVYSMLARRAFPETPVYLGGIEAVCADLRTTITGLTVLCRPFWNPPARTA